MTTRTRAVLDHVGIAVSDLERHQLQLLRQELGIDPPPTNHKEDKKPTEETIAA